MFGANQIIAQSSSIHAEIAKLRAEVNQICFKDQMNYNEAFYKIESYINDQDEKMEAILKHLGLELKENDSKYIVESKK